MAAMPSRTSCCQARTAAGPLATSRQRSASTLASSDLIGRQLVHEAHRMPFAALKRSAVVNQRRAACSPIARTT